MLKLRHTDDRIIGHVFIGDLSDDRRSFASMHLVRKGIERDLQPPRDHKA